MVRTGRNTKKLQADGRPCLHSPPTPVHVSPLKPTRTLTATLLGNKIQEHAVNFSKIQEYAAKYSNIQENTARYKQIQKNTVKCSKHTIECSKIE